MAGTRWGENMFKIRCVDGKDSWHLGPDGSMIEGAENCSSPIDAEEIYFRTIRHRMPCAMKISSDVPGVVAPAYYRMDADWSGPREQDLDRFAQIWSDVPTPTVFQSRGLIRANHLTGRQVAELVGSDDRTVRRWISETEPSKFPAAAWRVLLIRLGYLKVIEE